MASKYRRGGTWWARAQRDGREIRRSLETKDSRVADRRLKKFIDDLDGAKWGERPARGFEEAVDRFHRERFPALKASSQRRYKVSLANLVAIFGRMSLGDIASASLSEFETARRTEGAAAPTIRRDLACLSSMLSSAVDWQWIETNPVPAYLRRRSKRGLREAPGRTRYLSPDEEARLLQAATPAVARAIAFAIDTGLRREEQFSLTWDKVELSAHQIRLGAETKSGRGRLVPLLPGAARILAQLPRHFSSSYVFRHEPRKVNEKLAHLPLPDDDTKRRFNNMDKGLKAAARRAKISDLRWHDLRRTCGCRLLQDHGQSMQQVKEILGHASVMTTERSYAFLRQEDIVAGLTKTGTQEADSQ